MRNLTCDHCHRRIPTGEAVIRSRSLERVAYHRDCAEVVGILFATDAARAVSGR